MSDDDENENSLDNVINEIKFAMIAVRQMLEPIMREVEDYRIDMMNKGYNDYDARAMAVDYHGALMRMLIK